MNSLPQKTRNFRHKSQKNGTDSNACSPREMQKRLEVIRGIMFPSQTISNGINYPVQRSRKRNSKRLPPLETYFTDNSQVANLRINTFYGAPIGADNFKIKHMKPIYNE